MGRSQGRWQPDGFLSTLSLRRATTNQTNTKPHQGDFYPRSPCGERQRAEHHANSQQEFLSTLSLRRATTIFLPSCGRILAFLSTLSLRRATILNFHKKDRQINFYPRSPCGERLMHALKLANFVLFLSTLSLRRATVGVCKSDPATADFYPRSPCGERL